MWAWPRNSVLTQYRYYLAFDRELHSLLTTWHIGVTGVDAFRYGFCSRQLLTQFAYVTHATGVAA